MRLLLQTGNSFGLFERMLWLCPCCLFIVCIEEMVTCSTAFMRVD